MTEDIKQVTLRMIPYGLYVLTAEGNDGATAASAVSWVTQASFRPPMVAVCVQEASGTHEKIRTAGRFALNFLKKGQEEIARTCFRYLERKGDTIGGHRLERSPDGLPLLADAPAWLELQVVDELRCGDHAIFVGEVVKAGVRELPHAVRPDQITLTLRDLGHNVFYGGHPQRVAAA